MKIRTGFVSNSSSASFVVALRKSAPCPTCGHKEDDFLKYVEERDPHGGYETTRLKTRDVDELFKQFDTKDLDDSKWSTGVREIHNSTYARIKEAVEKGYEVAEIEVAYHDPDTNEKMHLMEAKKELVVLWSDHYDVKKAEL
jgi:hypothetical protein